MAAIAIPGRKLSATRLRQRLQTIRLMHRNQ